MSRDKKANLSIDLFAPVVPRERWHPNFQRIVDRVTEEERQVLRDWAAGFVDRDGKFVIEFQTTFNSSFWELYLYALLREVGCEVDLGFERPDFIVTGGTLGAFTAEAVVASNPLDGAPEWAADPHRPLPAQEDMLDLACLRLSQAITEKHRKWLGGYEALPQCTQRPFVVCVAPFEQPMASLQGTQAIDRVLFGGLRPVVVKDDSGTARVLGHSRTRETFKKSGARIDLGLFANEQMSAISAVIFSSLATWSKVHALSRPEDRTALFRSVRHFAEGGRRGMVQWGSDYKETLVDGAHIFLNPHAARPLDPTLWLAQGFGVHRFHYDRTISSLPDGALISRTATRFGINDGTKPALKPHPVSPAVKPHMRHRPPDGILFAGPSQLGATDSIELMLYKGWTIYVGRDMADNDWCTMGKKGSHLTVEEFHDADDESAFMGSFQQTRDDALHEAQQRIDGTIAGAPFDDDLGDD